jgi:DNA phosphorothioation-dependent restriction protein DptG
MKLGECLSTAYICGLESVEEAIFNIEHLATNLFIYEEIDNELKELFQEFKESGLALDTQVTPRLIERFGGFPYA